MALSYSKIKFLKISSLLIVILGLSNKIFINRIKKSMDLNAYIFFDEELILKRSKELDENKNNPYISEDKDIMNKSFLNCFIYFILNRNALIPREDRFHRFLFHH